MSLPGAPGYIIVQLETIKLLHNLGNLRGAPLYLMVQDKLMMLG